MADDKKSSSSDLRSNGIFLFTYDVDEDSSADAIEFILEANLEENPSYDHLSLIINSRGGGVFEGFALLDVIAGSRIPVQTIGIGIIASMGLLIFMSGKHRVLTPNTMIMSHQWWGVNWGKEHELIAARKKNELISNMIIEHYRKHTKMKEKEIRKFLLPESDIWLTAAEAKKFGICDEIAYL
jgi:ATP-dependent Clp protease protease subunit